MSWSRVGSWAELEQRLPGRGWMQTGGRDRVTRGRRWWREEVGGGSTWIDGRMTSA
jgi:hypothetical protein